MASVNLMKFFSLPCKNMTEQGQGQTFPSQLLNDPHAERLVKFQCAGEVVGELMRSMYQVLYASCFGSRSQKESVVVAIQQPLTHCGVR